MTGENAAPAEMPVASHGIASGETQPDLCSTAATQAPAAMPSVEEIRDLLCGYVPTLDASTEAARTIRDLFAPILAEKERVEKILELTRASRNRWFASVMYEKNRALAAEAALKLVAEQDVTEIALDPDWPRRICAAAIRAQVNNEPGA